MYINITYTSRSSLHGYIYLHIVNVYIHVYIYKYEIIYICIHVYKYNVNMRYNVLRPCEVDKESGLALIHLACRWVYVRMCMNVRTCMYASMCMFMYVNI